MIGSAPSPAGERAFRRALWLLPLALAAHNAEEWVGFAAYARRHGIGIGERQMRAALLLATVLPALLTAAAARHRAPRARALPVLAVAAALVANALGHLAQSVALRDYSPGTATGLALNLPVAASLYRRAARGGGYAPRELRRAMLGGLLAAFPATALLQAGGWLLARWPAARRA